MIRRTFDINIEIVINEIAGKSENIGGVLKIAAEVVILLSEEHLYLVKAGNRQK